MSAQTEHYTCKHQFTGAAGTHRQDACTPQEYTQTHTHSPQPYRNSHYTCIHRYNACALTTNTHKLYSSAQLVYLQADCSCTHTRALITYVSTFNTLQTYNEYTITHEYIQANAHMRCNRVCPMDAQNISTFPGSGSTAAVHGVLLICRHHRHVHKGIFHLLCT